MNKKFLNNKIYNDNKFLQINIVKLLNINQINRLSIKKNMINISKIKILHIDVYIIIYIIINRFYQILLDIIYNQFYGLSKVYFVFLTTFKIRKSKFNHIN